MYQNLLQKGGVGDMPAMEHLLNTGIRPEVIEELRGLAGEYGIRKMEESILEKYGSILETL